MTTNFPTSLDSYTNPQATDPLNNPPHHTQHDNENDAIVALETKVGINGSADTTSQDYKLTNVLPDNTAPTTSAVGDAAAPGSASKAARRDHVHGREAFATPAIALGTAAAAGAATTHIRSDATIAAFDTTAPASQAFGDAAATGSAAVAARRDHKHGMPADPRLAIVGINAQSGTTYTTVLGDAGELVTGSNGSATTFSIPTNASVAYPVGTVIMFAQVGAGQITINAVTPGTTTINSTGGTATAPKLRAQYSSASAIKTATDVWLVVGDIA